LPCGEHYVKLGAMSAGRPQSATEGVRLPQRQLLADDVYETVKGLLMDHSIAPGARLSIDGIELRMLLEPWAAARAAERAGEREVERLEAELASCPVAPAGTGYSDYRLISAHDTRFHDLVAEIAGNAHVRDAFTRTHAHLHLFRLSYGQAFGSEALREHRDVVRAIAAGDPVQAEQVMRAHLEMARERLLPVVG
jgi:DNA-binding GntR family transcriptional regulator